MNRSYTNRKPYRTSCFLTVLRALTPDELPRIGEPHLSRRTQKRLLNMVEQRLNTPGYVPGDNIHRTNPRNTPEPVSLRDFGGEGAEFEIVTWKKTLLNAAVCIALVVCLVGAGVYFRADIGAYLASVFEEQDGQPDSVVTTPAEDTTALIKEPEMETDLFTLSVEALSYDDDKTGLVLRLTDNSNTEPYDEIRCDRYVLSLYDESRRRWLTKIDLTESFLNIQYERVSELIFSATGENVSGGGTEAFLYVDQRLDQNGPWQWKLELYGLRMIRYTETDKVITLETDVSGYVSTVFETTVTSDTPQTYDIQEVPYASRAAENESDTLTLSLDNTPAINETQISVTLNGIHDDISGYVVYYNTMRLERWNAENETWDYVSGDTIFNRPKAMLMAGELHFWIGWEDPDLTPTLTLNIPPLTAGIYRVMLEKLISVRDAYANETVEYDLVEEVVENGAVSCLFTVNES
ncbi:MAG: hypothetical protein IJ449_02630 [Clostridia bacterium]|nr:hypothetical protein [Clostridia bacterium]